MSKSFAPAKPSVFGAIKKIFTKPARPAGGENLALRELLNKTVPSKARAASAEEMNKLKNLISEKTPARIATQSIVGGEAKKDEEDKEKDKQKNESKVKEVPEDVLKKILE